MDIRPLTKEQRRFAEENHHLVFTFLNQKDLPESAFYDVVIFGYLKAVQEYCEVQALHRFKFSTLAFQRMRSSLSNYYKCLSRPKRNAPVVSFSELIGDEGGLYWEEVISRQDELFQRLEAEMCLHALAARLPRREMRIIRMKVRGDRIYDRKQTIQGCLACSAHTGISAVALPPCRKDAAALQRMQVLLFGAARKTRTVESLPTL